MKKLLALILTLMLALPGIALAETAAADGAIAAMQAAKYIEEM